MWTGKRSAQDRLNDYWNALGRNAPPAELARLRAQLDPELIATIDMARARFRRLRTDPTFSDRLEGDLMNAFAVSPGGTAALPGVKAPPTNGRQEPRTPSAWLPSLGGQQTSRRSLAFAVGLAALLLVTLIGGFFVVSNRSDHPAVLQEGTPVSTPTQDWTNTRGDAGRTGLGASGPVGQPVTIWRFQADGPCDTAPAAVGDTVFSACGNGILYAIDRATGTERWQFSAQSPVVGGPTVLDGIVVLVDADGRLYGIDAATGEQRWLNEGTFYGAPVAKDGIIAVGGFDGQLAAIDLATGQERWRYMVEEGGEAKNPAIGDGIVYSGSIANGFSAVDLQTGELVWRADTNGIETGTAVVANGVAYIGSSPGVPEGFLNAYDAATGELLWSSDARIFSPAVKDGAGFAGSADGPVTAIDLTNGEILWQVTVGGVARPAIVAGDIVYINSDGDETVYAFDTATGDQLWSYPVDGYLGDAGALKDEVLYVNTGGGSIYAIGGEHAIPAAGTTAGSPEPAAGVAATVAASPVAATADLLAAEVLWTTSGGDGGFDLPGRVAIAPDGKIWVVDNRNHRFQIFDADGNFIETWGEQGKGDGQFQMMLQNQATFTDIVFAPDGSFAVLDPGNGRVQRFGPDRQFLSSFGEFGTGEGQFVYPLDLALSPDGTFWVTDDKRQDAQQFDPDGNVLSSFTLPEGYYFSWDHVIDGQGNHYLTVANGTTTTFEIMELDASGALARTIGAPSEDVPVFSSELTELAFDADGRMFVGSGYPEDSSIYVFDTNGTLLGHIEAGGIVQGLAIDDNGDLYVLNRSEGTLSKLRLLPSLDAPGETEATPETR